MLAFIDESGDTGLKVDKGSSFFFVVAMVVFENHEEAVDCDREIERLKRDLNLKNPEFKFGQLSKDKRIAFFTKLLPYEFYYYAVVINKDPQKLFGKGFRFKDSFYKFTCKLVFSNAKDCLRDAIVVIDGSGSRMFKLQLSNYIRKETEPGVLKNLKIQESHRNNLLQLADMVAGAVHRSLKTKNDSGIYREIIRVKEKLVQKWPK